MSPPQSVVQVDLSEIGADDAWIDDQALQLKRDAREQGIEINDVTDRSPEGTKSADSVTVGALLITIASSPVLVTVIGLLREWITRDNRRSVKITIGDTTMEMTSASSDDQQAIIDAWLDVQREGRR